MVNDTRNAVDIKGENSVDNKWALSLGWVILLGENENENDYNNNQIRGMQ